MTEPSCFLPLDDFKAALRRRMRARRGRYDRPAAAALLAAKRLPDAIVRRFRIVASYHPMGSEIDPRPLAGRFAEFGAHIVLPGAEGIDSPLVFRSAAGFLELQPDVLGVPSPPPCAPAAHPDLIIVPVLAFDRSGGRLGQGAGCYDRTLANLRSGAPVFALGLAYGFQEVPVTPCGPLDAALDAILTDGEYIHVGSGG